MREIRIASRETALQLVRAYPKKWTVISIRGPGAARKIDALKDCWNNLLILEMDDVWDRWHGGDMPTANDVRDALRFASRYADQPLLVHCDAGISRSSATAYVIACAERGEPPATVLENLLDEAVHMPNELIVKLGAVLLQNGRVYDAVKPWLYPGI